MNSTKTIALIVAAGEGVRLGGSVPKAYQFLMGKPLVQHSVELFTAHTAIDGVMVIYHPLHAEYINKIQWLYPQILVCEGGSTRQESVRKGLTLLASMEGTKFVLIHDAARPMVEAALIGNIKDALYEGAKAVIPVIPVVDTIKKVEGNLVCETADRKRLFSAQTPQGFHFSTILSLHDQYAERAATDDAMLAEWAGVEVKTVTGSLQNRKITTKEDLDMAEAIHQPQYRVGQGFDVHAFSKEGATGNISLCGVSVPCDARLVGHSDGDVGIHALVDAILGALALGDIGQHFPPSDQQWKGADSSIFLKHACQLMTENAASLVNADITIISEKPKVSPHREAMQQRLAEIMGVDASRISVKATTTEKLGFTGREEGIAAQAVVMVALHG